MAKKKQIHTRKELQEYRRKLRTDGTPAEAFLWKYLKARKLEGKRFQRQHSIENYIVDFTALRKNWLLNWMEPYITLLRRRKKMRNAP